MIGQLIKHSFVPYLFSKIPNYILVRLNHTDLLIIYYHMVSDHNQPHIKHLYPYKNIRQFKDDLDFLARKYSPVSLFDLLDFIKSGKSLPKKAFLLTFDDGFREMHDTVAPILVEKGIPATFFINSAFIDNKNLCYQHKMSILIDHLDKSESTKLVKKYKQIVVNDRIIFDDIKRFILSINYEQRDILDEMKQSLDVNFDEYLLKHEPYLTSNQIRRLIRDGFAIGAHSIDHPIYALLSLEDQLAQTLESIRLIRHEFSLNYGAFAFPNSDYGVPREFFIELRKSGLADVTFGTSGIGSDYSFNHFQRLSMEKPVIPAERIIALQCARRIWKRVKNNNKI